MTVGTQWISRMGLVFLAGLLPAGLVSGCGKDEDEVKILERPGRVASIDKESGIVEMWTYVPKYKKEIKITGTLDPNVEILINGAAATLDDLEIDDQVMVRGKAIKKNGERKFIAIKVEVTRPVSTTAPAQQPQTAASP